MAKKKQKTRKFNKFSVLFVVAVAALLLALTALWSVWRLQHNLEMSAQSEFQNMIKENRRRFKFEFCYNHNIRPCDDIAIKEFNAQPENKDIQFNL